MPFKDEEKQKKAVAKAQEKIRDKAKLYDELNPINVNFLTFFQYCENKNRFTKEDYDYFVSLFTPEQLESIGLEDFIKKDE